MDILTATGTAYYYPADASQQGAPGLAPAPEIVSQRHRRSNSSHVPPPLSSAFRHSKKSDNLTSPSTPVTASPVRGKPLRMPSQQAEKDAVDTLLFMSSPNNSGNLAHLANTTGAQPSPLRTEFPRKVMFQDRASSSSEPELVPTTQSDNPAYMVQQELMGKSASQ